MTTVDEAPDDSRQEYGWGLAPSHLRTRRQLREMGKSPGQSLVALMVGKVRGRRVVARLFDPDLAPAKRVPSDAQLAAIRKATTEHQLRAAERRGFSRTEMSAPAEPAPGWEQEPTLKEGNPMSDTETQSSTELGAIRSEVAALAAGGQIDPATARFIDSVASGSGEAPADPPQIAVPTGHGQRMAYLRATVATNQARHRDELLAAAAAQAQAAGEDAVAEFLAKSEQGQTRAEERIAAMEPNNPAATVAALADAMVWHENSQPAATALAQLRHDYAEQWGVRIDPRGFTVELDPDFDPVHAQDDAEAWQLRAREDAVLDSVSAMALPTDTKGPVMTALSDWRGIGVSPVDPRAHLRSESERRTQLAADLAAVAMPEPLRATVEFMVDYLRGSTGEVELLDSPVVVDPGEETRGRVPRLLASYANNPASAKIVAEEISVMTADDQAKVRDAGRAIRDKREVDYEVFPGYVDRYALGEALADYAAETAELLDTADHLAQGGMDHEEVNRLGVVFSSAGMTVTDDVNGQITRLAEQRTHLRSQILDGQGLIAMERAQLAAVLDDIDTGRIHGPAQLPELLFADETTKADADTRRVHERSVRLATATREAITQCIDATQLVDPRGRDAENLKFATSSVGDSIYSVACGAKGMGIEYERKSYAEKRARLERTLGDAGLHLPTRMEIRELVDDRARQAGTLGQAAARREHEWKAKVDRVVSARDDAIAQRTAAAAGRAPSPAGRGCVSRPDRAAQSEVPARAAGRRPQRGQGVEL